MNNSKYVKIGERIALAYAYLFQKTSSINVALLERHSYIMAKAMGKNKKLFQGVKSFMEGIQALREVIENPEVKEDLQEVYEAETEYSGSAGVNCEEVDIPDPYTLGMTEGFSLQGVGQAYRRPALKVCENCGEERCSHQTEKVWVVNPKLFEQEGPTQDLGGGITALKYNPQEEDTLATSRSLNGEVCINMQKIGEVQKVHDGHENGVYLMFDKEGSLVKCPKCRGTGTMYPRCGFCQGNGGFLFEEYIKCPVCNGGYTMPDKVVTHNTSVQGASPSSGRDAQSQILQVIKMATQFSSLKDDFQTWIEDGILQMRVAMALKTHQKKLEQKKKLQSVINTGEANDFTMQAFQKLERLSPKRELDFYKQALVGAIRSDKVKADWFYFDEKGNPNWEEVDSSKWEATSLVMEWILQQRESLENKEFQANIAELWNEEEKEFGPYRIERELGSAELMNYEEVEDMDVRHDPEPTFNFISDSADGYNPGIDWSRKALDSAMVDTIMGPVFGLISSTSTTMAQMVDYTQGLMVARRPEHLTVGMVTKGFPFANQPSEAVLASRVWKGKIGGKPIVAFQPNGKAWFSLELKYASKEDLKARRNPLWKALPLQGFNSPDTISRFQSNTLTNEGVMEALGLIGATMGRKWKEDLSKIEVPQGLNENLKEAYQVASLVFQWYPENWKKGQKLPSLFYIRYHDGEWKTAPSRITQGASLLKAKEFCKANEWPYHIIQEDRGRWAVSHLECASTEHQETLNGLMALWMKAETDNFQKGLKKFKTQMESSRSRWAPVYQNWKAQRDELKKLAGNTRAEKIKVHGSDYWTKIVQQQTRKALAPRQDNWEKAIQRSSLSQS